MVPSSDISMMTLALEGTNVIPVSPDIKYPGVNDSPWHVKVVTQNKVTDVTGFINLKVLQSCLVIWNLGQLDNIPGNDCCILAKFIASNVSWIAMSQGVQVSHAYLGGYYEFM